MIKFILKLYCKYRGSHAVDFVEHLPVAAQILQLKQEVNRWKRHFEVKETIVEALVLENQKPEAENLRLRHLLEKFCTKSNGLSVYARSEAYHQNQLPKDLTERIMGLYNYQCDVEEALSRKEV